MWGIRYLSGIMQQPFPSVVLVFTFSSDVLRSEIGLVPGGKQTTLERKMSAFVLVGNKLINCITLLNLEMVVLEGQGDQPSEGVEKNKLHTAPVQRKYH